jgi:site-specific DNA-methyltransferase (adenine-specific)
MKPYYEHAGMTIYNCDCREILPELPKVDLVLTDPPYNLAGESAMVASNLGGHAQNRIVDQKWDVGFDPTEFLSLLQLQDDATAVVFTSHFLFGAIQQWAHKNADYNNFGTWVKPNPMPSLTKRRFTWGVELFVYMTWGKHTFNFPEDGHALNWKLHPNGAHETEHPTEKPVGLFTWLASLTSGSGDIILDPFMGSGTTLRAAKDLGRKAIGIEIEERYCEIAAERLSQEVLAL